MNHKGMNKIQKRTPYFLLSLALFCVLFLVFMPIAQHLLEKSVRRRAMETAAGFGLTLNRFQIVNVGFNGAHFRGVEIGKTGGKKLKLPDIHVFYTLGGIRRGEINSIHIVGLTVHATVNRRGEIKIDGVPSLSDFTKRKRGKETANPILPPIPDIFLDNAFVFLKTPFGSLLIPGSVECRFSGGVCRIGAQLFPEGGTLFANGRIVLPVMDGVVNVSWDKIASKKWLRNFLKGSPLSVSGTLSGKAAITLEKGRPVSGSLEIRTRGAEVRFRDIFLTLNAHGHTLFNGNTPEQLSLSMTVFSLVSEKLKLAAPATIQLTGKTPDSLQVSVPKIRLLNPLPLTVSLSGKISGISTTPKMKGQYALHLPPKATAEFFPGLPSNVLPVKIGGNFKAELKNGRPLFSLSARAAQPLALSLPEGKAKMATVTVTATASGSPEKTRISTTLRIKSLSASLKGAKTDGETLSMKASGTAGLAGVNLTALRVVFSNFNLDDGKGDKIAGFSGKAYFSPGSKTNGGLVSILNVVTPDISFSNVQGKFKQLKSEFSFSGSAALPVAPLKLAFNGVFDPAKSHGLFSMDFHLPETVLPEGTDLSPIVSSLAGFSATGKVEMSGKISLKRGNSPVSTAKLNVRDLALSAKDDSVKVTDINTTISFTDLMDMVSQPSQLATVAQVTAGPVQLEKGKLRFQLLDSDTVSIESVGFAFANGEMNVSAFLLSATKPDMDFGIYCHELQLTSLLNLAMGEGKAEGEGTVSGYIPLQIKNGSLVFGKGFLQSVPGRPGTIRIADSKDITGGIVLAEEAVKDFSYQWARVNLESQNGNLNLLLKLEGKPNRKLPLIYDQESGEFIKDPKDRRLVSLQGLTLDLKFVDIDINRLLKQQGKVKFTSK